MLFLGYDTKCQYVDAILKTYILLTVRNIGCIYVRKIRKNPNVIYIRYIPCTTLLRHFHLYYLPVPKTYRSLGDQQTNMIDNKHFIS